MKKILISMAAIAGAFLWGCDEPEEVIDYSSQELKVAATIEQSRTSVTSSSVAWAAGDEIKLVCENEEYAFTTTESGESAEFTSTSEITPATIEGCAVVAYYGCNSLGAYTIAQNQTVKGGVNDTKVPMYAYTAETPEQAVLPMTFKPAASVLEVQFGAKEISVESISLSPAAGAMVTGGLCGTFNVNALTGKVSAKNTLETLTVTFDQSQSLAEGLSVQIPIGWCTVTGGLKLAITYNDGSLYEDVIWGEETVSTFVEVDGVQSYKYFVTEVEIDLGPRNWYVKANGDANSKGRNWASATTLSNALVNAAAGSTIHLAAGTYIPENYILGDEENSEARKTFELSKALTLVGGYPEGATEGAVADATANATILDGNAVSYHAVVVTSAEKVTIEGLTIQNGNNSAAYDIDKETGAGFVTSSVNGALIEDKSGAGLYVAAGNIELKNCVVCDNKGIQGAGVYAKDATVAIYNTTITRNSNTSNGSGLWLWNGDLTIENSTISANGDTETAGVGRGLYIYAEAEKSATAIVKNTTISGNLANEKGNNTGVYVRGADATANATAAFENCVISNNEGAMGAGAGVTFATVSFDECKFEGNVAGNNGVFYFLNSADVTIRNSQFVKNVANNKNGVIYCYSNTEACGVDLNITNSLFECNEALDRGSAIYARSDAAATVAVNCANTTFANNAGGTVIHTYMKNGGTVVVNLISSTIAGNTVPGEKAKGAILSEETASTTINLYNTIVSNNTAAADTYQKGTFLFQNSVVGSAVYGADGAVAEGSFATTDFGTYADGVYPVSESSVAWTGGMSAADLYTLGSGLNANIFTEEVMKADQKGNSRMGNAMGAYVGK